MKNILQQTKNSYLKLIGNEKKKEMMKQKKLFVIKY